MEEYALIMRHPDGQKLATPEQMRTWMKQTAEWLDGIRAQDKLVERGHGLLFGEARVVFSENEVVKGPFGSFHETIGGYIVVKAESVDEAVEFAKGSPVLQSKGNSVEIRKIAR